MSRVPNLLNDDGSASIATSIMMSHHGFRRDLMRFAAALTPPFDPSKADALAGEWQSFRATLHGHHEAEDHALLPSLRDRHPQIVGTAEQLSADHRRIEPLLEQGDRAFARLIAAPTTAADVVRELQGLLSPHLALEEAEIIPYLRDAKAFPPPPNEQVANMYAQGFAWAMDGVAPEVLERVYAMLPPTVLELLPAARAAFAERRERVWGAVRPLASYTPIPAF